MKITVGNILLVISISLIGFRYNYDNMSVSNIIMNIRDNYNIDIYDCYYSDYIYKILDHIGIILIFNFLILIGKYEFGFVKILIFIILLFIGLSSKINYSYLCSEENQQFLLNILLPLVYISV